MSSTVHARTRRRAGVALTLAVAIIAALIGFAPTSQATTVDDDECRIPGVDAVQEYRFRTRTKQYGEIEVKYIKGWQFEEGGATFVTINGHKIPGKWVATASSQWNRIPDVIINAQWGSGGIPGNVLGKGTVSLSVYGGPNVTVNYDAHSEPYFQDYTPWSMWSDWSTTYPGAPSDTFDVESRTKPGTGTETQSVPCPSPSASAGSCDAPGVITGIEDTDHWTVSFNQNTYVATFTPKPPVVFGKDVQTVFDLSIAKQVEDCDEDVTPEDPTVRLSQECGVPGELEIPNTTGVQYLFNDEPIEPGVYKGARSGVVTAEAKQGYVLTEALSFPVDIPETQPCPDEAVPVTPDVRLSQECGVDGELEIYAAEGVTYFFNGDPIAPGVYKGARSGVITAEAEDGYVLKSPLNVQVDIPDTEPCPEEVTPQTPAIRISEECGVDGELEIFATPGVTYYLDGDPIAPGVYEGARSGVITAVAEDGYVLTEELSLPVEIPEAEECTEDTTPTTTPTTTPSTTPTTTPTTEPPTTVTTEGPEVGGIAETVPPAVVAGGGAGLPRTGGDFGGLLLVGLLMLGAGAVMRRSARWAR